MNYHFSQSMGFLSGKLSRLTGQMLEKRFRARGIGASMEQWRILAMLSQYNGASITYLAQYICLSLSSVSRQVKLLEAMGLVRWEKDSKDKKQKNVYLTPEGLRCNELCCAQGGDVLRGLRPGFTLAEETLFVDMIERLIRNAEADLALPCHHLPRPDSRS